MKILGRNPWGGKIIEIRIPLSILHVAEEITEQVESGEVREEGAVRERWLSQVQPHVLKALNGYPYSPSADQIVLRPLESVSTLKQSRLVRPSGAAVVSAARHHFGNSLSRSGRRQLMRRRAGR